MNHVMTHFQEFLESEHAFDFLINLAFDLTISARETYVAGQETVESPVALRGLNEINHRVLSRAMSVLDDSWKHTPAAFCEMIFGIAKSYGCVENLEVALNMSFEKQRRGRVDH
ncbi:hypothetical protein [Massilia sp. TSP1-1-2]|uniref:hypothetical protein n=1 Tax=unclassified Massilia TaxID=2609279 RepID=UPI003CF8E7BD